MLAILGGTFGDGASTGAVAATLEDILNTSRSSYRQLDVKASSANTGAIYVGDSLVSSTNAWVELQAGESWGLNPQSFTSPAGSDFELNLAEVYVVGTTVADQAFVVALA